MLISTDLLDPALNNQDFSGGIVRTLDLFNPFKDGYHV